MYLVLNQSPLSTIFAIVRFPGGAKFVLSGDLLGFADLHCQKVQSTKWLKHKLRATIGGQ